LTFLVKNKFKIKQNLKKAWKIIKANLKIKFYWNLTSKVIFLINLTSKIMFFMNLTSKTIILKNLTSKVIFLKNLTSKTIILKNLTSKINFHVNPNLTKFFWSSQPQNVQNYSILNNITSKYQNLTSILYKPSQSNS
jgi:hypothetical protein